jgi:hypothetical protein
MGKPTYGEFSFPSDFGFSGSGGKEMVRGYSRGGAKKKTMAKVGKVMQEFAEGELHSGSKKGPKVTNPKQALAIGYSEAKAKKAQAGGRILQDESMQGRLPQNAAMAAQREAGTTMPNRLMPARALRPMGATMTDRERAMMDPARRVQRPQPDVSPDRARARVMEQMEEMGGRRVARKDGGRTKHEDAKMDKKVVEKVVKKHASLPAAKAHKGLGVPVHKSKPKIA